MAQSFVEVEIRADEQMMEPLIGLMSQLGFEGFWEDGPTLRCFMNEARWQPDMLEEVRHMAGMLVRSGSSPVPVITSRALEEKNWNSEWEQTIRPIRVTDRIVITPTWHTYNPAPGDLVLTIDPKMSFGTGYHETTRLCLQLLEKHIAPGMRVLDVGTGTGVLAIAAIKLGASLAVGVDVDEWSFNNAGENVRLNDVHHSITILQGDITAAPSPAYDIVVANIQMNVLSPMLPEIKQRLTLDGVVLLSGLLTHDEEPMIEALHAEGFRVMEELQEHEWIAFAAHRHG